MTIRMLAYSLAAALCGLSTPSKAQTALPDLVGAAAQSLSPIVYTEHSVRIRDRELRYRAGAGYLKVVGSDGKSSARIFFVSYSRLDRANDPSRPILFAYNGGPGGSSALIHMAGFGPRILKAIDLKDRAPFSAQMMDNPDSLIEVADLVFIDPVGSGYSRLDAGAEPSAFFGVDQDAKATAQFITRYLATGHREASPKYLAGESYGTLRSVEVAKALQQSGTSLDGLILMGTILDNSTLFAQAGNDEPYWLFLPTEAAVAWYHGLRPDMPSLDRLLDDARDFASGRYLTALAAGDALKREDRAAVAARLTRMMVLPPEVVDGADLRVSPDIFSARLLSSQKLNVARADGRVTGTALAGEPGPSTDLLYSRTLPVYQQATTAYLSKELNVRADMPYVLLDSGIADRWQWTSSELGSPTAVSVGFDLRDAMAANPKLRVLSANGIYDMTSPFLAAEYTMHHLGVSAEVKSRISYRYYRSGHMIYITAPERAQLSNDIKAFILHDHSI